MSDKKSDSKFFEEPIEFGKPIVTNGRIFCFPLKSSIRESNIKRGSCVSIEWDSIGSIFYGLIIGEESHIFMFDSNSTIEDIGKLDVKDPLFGTLNINNNNIICCISVRDNYSKIFIYNLEKAMSMYSHMWGHFSFSPIEDSGIIIEGESIVASHFNYFDNKVYFLSNEGNLYSYSSYDNQLNLIAKVSDKNLSPAICSNPENGNIYGVTSKEGIIWKLSGKKIVYTDVRIPCMKNRNYVAGVSNLLWFEGRIYGGTTQDAYLFEYNVEDDEIKNLGRPDENAEIRGIDILPQDGRIFGITATKDRGMGHIFSFSQKKGFIDIGIIQGYQTVHDFAYEPICIKAGSSGDFLIGNAESRLNIFLFCSAPE